MIPKNLEIKKFGLVGTYNNDEDFNDFKTALDIYLIIRTIKSGIDEK